ncbi:hypothetical protein B0I37DRAFT_363412 [Chaetomium sp. MPI-CAGE-AT-0009]|nr:hypothetical protein B0I37DRAFT_363412 [Chaetomium sp. MPI-CAGE-AT-0009]
MKAKEGPQPCIVLRGTGTTLAEKSQDKFHQWTVAAISGLPRVTLNCNEVSWLMRRDGVEEGLQVSARDAQKRRGKVKRPGVGKGSSGVGKGKWKRGKVTLARTRGKGLNLIEV